MFMRRSSRLLPTLTDGLRNASRNAGRAGIDTRARVGGFIMSTGDPRKDEGYVNASSVLPDELVGRVQAYVSGIALYIPVPTGRLLARDAAICSEWVVLMEGGMKASVANKVVGDAFGVTGPRVWQITNQGGVRSKFKKIKSRLKKSQ